MFHVEHSGHRGASVDWTQEGDTIRNVDKTEPGLDDRRIAPALAGRFWGLTHQKGSAGAKEWSGQGGGVARRAESPTRGNVPAVVHDHG